jgi:antitoxin CptB
MESNSKKNNRIKRLKIQSWRRGIKEMDLILGTFANMNLECLSEDELDVFDDLLLEDDHLLFSWVSGKEDVPEKFGSMVSKISSFSK